MRPLTDDEHKIEDNYRKSTFRHLSRAERSQLARSTISLEILTVLASDEWWETRAYVAQNKYTSLSLLEQMSEDINQNVRYWCVTNSNISLELLRKLENDSYVAVREIVKTKLNAVRK